VNTGAPAAPRRVSTSAKRTVDLKTIDLSQRGVGQNDIWFLWQGAGQMRNRLVIGASIFFFAAPIETGLANALEERLAGAWAQSESDCKEVFEAKAGSVTFRQPVNTFISAFIVKGQDVTGVNGSCHINSASSSENGYLRLKLECRTAISFLPMDARVKIMNATQISYGDFSSDPTIDATYQRCTP